MKTITLTDDQFETLFEFVDQKVEYIVDKSVEYQDSEMLEDCQDYWEEHYDDVVKDIKEYANSKFKKPMGDRNVN